MALVLARAGSAAARCAPRPARAAAAARPALARAGRAPARDVRAAFFNFNKMRTDSKDAGIYGSQGREDYSADDVEHYFNYMGMLAVEGTYDRMEAMLGSGLDPVDVLLLMASSENDAPKVEELLAAGANVNVTDSDGRSPLQLAEKPEVVTMLQAAVSK
ncbi:hypothetical protein HT031_005724 [Scenedesmus sp. PABB004]|nr:hypothetical protein HT031_005724 [Scenedesmus sp. PABB004]